MPTRSNIRLPRPVSRFMLSTLIMMSTSRWALAFVNSGWKSAVKVRCAAKGSCQIHRSQSRTFLASTNLQSTDTQNQDQLMSRRQQALHESLRKFHLDPMKIEQANAQNMNDPTTGYDTTLGRAAIRAYRSFVYSTKIPDNLSSELLAARADVCARQIDFLRRRQLSHETEWVRHTDSEDKLLGDQPARRFPLLVVLDNIRSAFNVGSIFRTADACGVQEVITTGITAHPRGSGAEKLSKSALGAERVVSNRHFTTTRDALVALREEYKGWALIGLETTDNSVDYTSVEFPAQCILILGNEVTGINPEVLVELDHVLEIPMYGNKNSLNVAACAPVVLYEIIRQWGVSGINKRDD